MNDEKKLRLVHGGKTSTDQNSQDWSAKHQALCKIEQVLRISRSGAFGPRDGFALLLGALVAGVVIGVDRLAAYFDVRVDGGISGMLAIFLFLVTAFTVRAFSRKPRRYSEVLDGLLMDYDPVSIDHYRKLQDQVSTFGMDRNMVTDWLAKERYALAVAAGWPTSEVESFTSRRL
jgi:hypothetical protein